MERFVQRRKRAGALFLALSLAAAFPAVSWADDIDVEYGAGGTDSPETVSNVVYGPGSYVVGRDISPGEYAVFTEDTSAQSAYSTCTVTLYKDDSDERRIGTFQFQHHGLITLYKGQHLIITKGYAMSADEAGITLGTTGMYKAGRDMEPGTYRITPLTSGGGYYALYNDVRYYYDYIDEYATLFEPMIVNVKEGQYLELFDAGAVERM